MGISISNAATTPGAYTKIATLSSSGAAIYTFNSVGTHKVYKLILRIDSVSAGDTICLRFNGDNAAHYTYLGTTGAAWDSSGAFAYLFLAQSAASGQLAGELTIQSSATDCMVFSGLTGFNTAFKNYWWGKWNNSAAITSITILTQSGATFSIKATLYYVADLD